MRNHKDKRSVLPECQRGHRVPLHSGWREMEGWPRTPKKRGPAVGADPTSRVPRPRLESGHGFYPDVQHQLIHHKRKGKSDSRSTSEEEPHFRNTRNRKFRGRPHHSLVITSVAFGINAWKWHCISSKGPWSLPSTRSLMRGQRYLDPAPLDATYLLVFDRYVSRVACSAWTDASAGVEYKKPGSRPPTWLLSSSIYSCASANDHIKTLFELHKYIKHVFSTSKLVRAPLHSRTGVNTPMPLRNLLQHHIQYYQY